MKGWINQGPTWSAYPRNLIRPAPPANDRGARGGARVPRAQRRGHAARHRERKGHADPRVGHRHGRAAAGAAAAGGACGAERAKSLQVRAISDATIARERVVMRAELGVSLHGDNTVNDGFNCMHMLYPRRAQSATDESPESRSMVHAKGPRSPPRD